MRSKYLTSDLQPMNIKPKRVQMVDGLDRMNIIELGNPRYFIEHPEELKEKEIDMQIQKELEKDMFCDCGGKPVNKLIGDEFLFVCGDCEKLME